MKIVVISPTYNERENIGKLLDVLENEVFPKIKGAEMYILIADDKSPDGTVKVVRDAQKKWKNIELIEGEKEGLGAAYVRAMKYAMDKMKAAAVIEFDSDFQHDPNDIPRLVAAFLDGADYVIGSRYVRGGKIPSEWGLHRKFMSYFGSLFARIVLLQPQVHDMTSGFKLTRTSFLKRVDLDNLYSKYYAYKIHILHDVLRQNPKVVEVPIIFYERERGSSKLSRKDLFDSFFVVIRLRIRDSKRFIKFLIVGGTGFVLQIVTQEVVVRSGLALFLAENFSNFLFALTHHRGLIALRDGIGGGFGAEAAIISNFMFNNFWTFNDARKLKEKSPFFMRLVKFNITSLLAIFIQAFSIWFFVRTFGEQIDLFGYIIPTRIAVVIPTIILVVIPLNYLIYNRLIWKTQYLKNEVDKKT